MSVLKKVAYIYSDNLRIQCDRLPTMLNRASVVQDLINSFGLLSHPDVFVVQSQDGSEDELKLFHSSSYVDFLKKLNEAVDLEKYEEELEEFGLNYDCPLLQNGYDFVRVLAGGSLTAAKLLAGKKCEIAINWFGGWHHAQRDCAAGFCYINDIVLAIHKLTETYKRILYVDLDVHHGDGVQNAFEFSEKILTLSFHKLAPGFYPGTGGLEDIGSSKGKYFTINVPLLNGVGDKTYTQIFSLVFPKVFNAFKPDALVVQCGADSLNGDEVGESNLTLNGMGYCIQKVLECKKPTLFCGGGGYNFPNTARLWTYLTSLILGYKLENDIPDNSEYFMDYAPTYELHIDSGNQKDYNTENHLQKIVSTISGYCDFIEL